jgi:uncharacterized damage-inducible protein DinB
LGNSYLGLAQSTGIPREALNLLLKKHQDMTPDFVTEFSSQCIFRNEESLKRILLCIETLDETLVWARPNEHSNSVGNIILHLCGNITQYVISCLGNTADKRQRASEFSTMGGFSKMELIEKLQLTIGHAHAILRHLTPADFEKKYSVQGFHLSGIGITIHVTEHLSYHTGQIAFWVKQLKNKELGFYDGIDLNANNER